jgi:hypothetical protein
LTKGAGGLEIEVIPQIPYSLAAWIFIVKEITVRRGSRAGTKGMSKGHAKR